MKSATQVQALDEAVWTSLCSDPLGERHESICSSLIYGYIEKQTEFFSFSKATSLEEKLWIQTRFAPLKKIDLVSHPIYGRGVGIYDVW